MDPMTRDVKDAIGRTLRDPASATDPIDLRQDSRIAALEAESGGPVVDAPKIVLPGQTPTGVGVELVFGTGGLDDILRDGVPQ